MRWAVGLAVGLGLTLAASAAAACPATYRCPPGHAYDGPTNPPPPRYLDEQPGAARDTPPAPPPPARPAPVPAPAPPPPPPPPPTEGELYTQGTVWRYEQGGMYMHGYRAAPCRCTAAGALSHERSDIGYERSEVGLSNSFFANAGGVGPFPSGGYYDHGGYYVFVRHGGGFRGGGHMGGGRRR